MYLKDILRELVAQLPILLGDSKNLLDVLYLHPKQCFLENRSLKIHKNWRTADSVANRYLRF
jgi:hypothetical protein